MSHLLSTDTAQIWLQTRGQGPPVVLLHGGPGIYDYLSDSVMASWLAPRYTVVGFDQRGCRRSHCRRPFTVDANVGDVEAVRRHLQAERIFVIGHSWGGLLATCYAVAHPQCVAGLVLIGSIGTRPGWEEPFWQTLAKRHTPQQRSRLAKIDAEIARCRDGMQRQELYRRRFNAALPSYLAPGHRHVAPELESYHRWVSVSVMASVHRSRYADRAWVASLGELQVPVTIIHGRDDPVPWSVVEDLQHVMPQATVAALDDCGHFPWLETPDRFEPVLREAVGEALG
ncbi:MAG: alpha/beta hydrolase [bacterium]|nr:alpha/beta hydrolase [bacterium]